MIRLRALLLSLLAAGFLSACGAARQQSSLNDPLLPLPADLAVQDPGNEILMASLEDYVQQRSGPANTQFEYTRIDLNGDGRREGIVIMSSPHSYWCNLDGCTMLVFEAKNEGFVPRAQVAPVRGPLLVSRARSNGWNDIVLRVTDHKNWNNTRDVALRFDGRSYPPRPDRSPEVEVASIALEGVRIFP